MKLGLLSIILARTQRALIKTHRKVLNFKFSLHYFGSTMRDKYAKIWLSKCFSVIWDPGSQGLTLNCISAIFLTQQWIGFACVTFLLRDLIGSLRHVSLFVIIWLWKDASHYKLTFINNNGN